MNCFRKCFTNVFASGCVALVLTTAAQGQGAILRVDGNSSGGDGSSWLDAIKFLEVALATAGPSDTIWVASGTYKPNDLSGTLVRNQWFVLVDQVVVQGGYAGLDYVALGAASPNSRDIQAYATILSGDLLGNDTDFELDPDNWFDASRDDNAFSVVFVQDAQAGTRLDGFFIEGGRANDPGTANFSIASRGGGIYCVNSAAEIVNCTFRYNSAGEPLPEGEPSGGMTGIGGGAAVTGGQTAFGSDGFTRFIDCVFHDNLSSRGGGLAVEEKPAANDPISQVEILNSLFYDNRALINKDPSPESAEGSGGAIFVTEEANVEIINCTFSNKNASDEAGS